AGYRWASCAPITCTCTRRAISCRPTSCSPNCCAATAAAEGRPPDGLPDPQLPDLLSRRLAALVVGRGAALAPRAQARHHPGELRLLLVVEHQDHGGAAGERSAELVRRPLDRVPSRPAGGTLDR